MWLLVKILVGCFFAYTVYLIIDWEKDKESIIFNLLIFGGIALFVLVCIYFNINIGSSDADLRPEYYWEERVGN